MPHVMPNWSMLECMRLCGECTAICNLCAHHCLHMGGEHASPEHQGIMRDCSEICALAAGFMGRSSHFANNLCRFCSQVCGECAASCERLSGDDDIMTRCTQICRQCEVACETMDVAK